MAVLIVSLMTVGLMARTGNTGGDIRHGEVRDEHMLTASGQVVEGPIGAMIHTIEPNPDKFMAAMVFSIWYWTFMMILHYFGLILIIGTVDFWTCALWIPEESADRPGSPAASLGNGRIGHQCFDGMLGFIGQPMNYIYRGVFWYKMLSLVLLGVNAAAFYLTDVFKGVENVGAGEDARCPPSWLRQVP